MRFEAVFHVIPRATAAPGQKEPLDKSDSSWIGFSVSTESNSSSRSRLIVAEPIQTLLDALFDSNIHPLPGLVLASTQSQLQLHMESGRSG
jgi:hypothetical protein